MTDLIPETNQASEQSNITNVVKSRVTSIESDLVVMHKSAARSVIANEVDLNSSAAYDVRASLIQAHQAAIGLIKTNEITMTDSGVLAIRSDVAKVNGVTGVVVAQTANLSDTYSGMVTGRDVHGQHIKTFILLANRVEGEVRTVLDSRQAIIVGLVGGLFAGLVFSITNALLRRD